MDEPRRDSIGWRRRRWVWAMAVVGWMQMLTVPAALAAPKEARFTCQRLVSSGQHPFGLVAGDWNRDGRTDLAATFVETSDLIPFLNQGKRSFVAGPPVKVGKVPRGITLLHLDEDGDPDLVVSNASSNDITFLRGDGGGGFATDRELIPGVAPFHSVLGDFDGDQKPDLLVVNETNLGFGTPGLVTLYYDVRRITETAKLEPQFLTAGTHPADAVAGDFNHDGRLDLIVANWMSGDLTVFLNQGNRQFTSSTVRYGGELAYSIYAADFNRDGKLDVAVPDVTKGGVWAMAGDGQGGFAKARFHATGVGVRCVTGGDLDGDGHIDLVTADTATGTVSILRGRGDGDFAAARSIAVGPLPRMVMVHDLDGDGRLDIAATPSGSNDVSVLFQTTNPGDVPCTSPTPVLRQ